MSSRNLVSDPSRLAGAGSSKDTSTADSAAGIEIVGFPQTLYTRTLGDPSRLFVPLLDATREAYTMVERLAGHGENRANAVMLSGMHLVSSLLRDSSFSLGARGLSHENMYTVDLDAGTLQVNTRLYAVVSRRASFFKVEIAGKVSGGPFVVRNPLQGNIIMQVDEERLKQPSFFTSVLPQECLRAQMDQERFGRIDETLGAGVSGETRFVVTVEGSKVPVAVRPKSAGTGWDIIDGRRQDWLGALPPEMEEHLKAVTSFIEGLLAPK